MAIPDDNLFNAVSTPIIIIIFILAGVGMTTCAVEQNRKARWKQELNWLPGKGTEIFPLEAGQISQRFWFKSWCYRVRSYPAENTITTYTPDSNRKLVPIPSSCNTAVCPERYFQLQNDGYLFLETALAEHPKVCAQLVKGWDLSQLPPKIAEQLRATQNAERAKEEAERQAREKRELKASFDLYSKWLNNREILSVSRKRECFADNVRETDDPVLIDIARVGDGNSWYYSSVTMAGQLQAVFFDARGASCNDALRKIIAAGFTKDWKPLNMPVKWDEATNAPARFRIPAPTQELELEENARTGGGGDDSSQQPRELRGNERNIREGTNREFKEPAKPYEPPTGWRLDEGNCAGNVQYVPEIAKFICEITSNEEKRDGRWGRWLECQGTDHWNQAVRCPFGKTVFAPYK